MKQDYVTFCLDSTCLLTLEDACLMLIWLVVMTALPEDLSWKPEILWWAILFALPLILGPLCTDHVLIEEHNLFFMSIEHPSVITSLLLHAPKHVLSPLNLRLIRRKPVSLVDNWCWWHWGPKFLRVERCIQSAFLGMSPYLDLFALRWLIRMCHFRHALWWYGFWLAVPVDLLLDVAIPNELLNDSLIFFTHENLASAVVHFGGLTHLAVPRVIIIRSLPMPIKLFHAIVVFVWCLLRIILLIWEKGIWHQVFPS